MVVENLAFPDKAKPPFRLVTSPCYNEEPFASTVNSAISISGRFRDVEHECRIDPRVLGTGSHGSARRCLDRATDEQYAAKSIRKVDPAVTPAGLAREAGPLQEMKRRNIVRLVDVYEDAGYPHVATDPCRGGELFNEMIEKKSSGGNSRPPRFAEDEAARILRQLLAAVSYMHERGVAHRDIEPASIPSETTDATSPIKV